jgi:hypothetical protein
MSHDAKDFPSDGNVKGTQDGVKLLHETCKHLTTMSSGSILILSSFFTKASAYQFKSFLIISLIILLISAALSVFAMYFIAAHLAESKESSLLSKGPFFIAGLSFGVYLVGLSVLVIFVAKNL